MQPLNLTHTTTQIIFFGVYILTWNDRYGQRYGRKDSQLSSDELLSEDGSDSSPIESQLEKVSSLRSYRLTRKPVGAQRMYPSLCIALIVRLH